MFCTTASPETGSVSFSREIRCKNRLQLFRCNPFPAIGYHDFNAIDAAFTCFNRNRALTPNGMNGVQVQIQQNLRQPVGIGLNSW